ncbi:peptide ABC transporter ATP-binding protein [Siminovitchia terrae]|uniref:ABC transporter ATP-binding protein n=1 Tax=Siminovitchia terrae TaxID=1914933 RepID=A0A429X6B7_SIMTE|nr:ABC transporter ATP-binding protein [Siminovitchia terrae]RST58813.1 ABC transporter ATP-binding protein [Siminovitchia terrae]GIN89323.1 peptide ABC transporter ATP-binding protein [Siminovitchia terrae]GIN95388.1 peptide ABC transporter ATP-binding protein [Siminovitchia terrae]
MSNQSLLEIKNLKTSFSTEAGPVTAVDGVSFSVKKGETVGVVGESGCGKSVTASSILRLLHEGTTKYEGEVLFEGKNLLKLSKEEMRHIRGNRISMVFQDPMTSLNPVQTIGDQIAEAIIIHQKVKKAQAYKKAIEMLRLTGIPAPDKRVDEYPHEISGGMRQRVLIAMALSCKPNVLIADEPTTALDVTIQAQILDLINDLKEELNMGVMMITHDLGVVAEVCQRVVVMYLGQVIEEGDVAEIFARPLHPYTKGLLKSIPQLDGDRSEKLHVIQGVVPPLTDVPPGCRFAPRCSFADEQCASQAPELQEVGGRQKVRCWHFEKIMKEEEHHVATV